jgi:hypothetical protein
MVCVAGARPRRRCLTKSEARSVDAMIEAADITVVPVTDEIARLALPPLRLSATAAAIPPD